MPFLPFKPKNRRYVWAFLKKHASGIQTERDRILTFGVKMKRLLVFFLIGFVLLCIWYFRGMPQQLKSPVGKMMGWACLLLWLYLLIKYGSFRFV